MMNLRNSLFGLAVALTVLAGGSAQAAMCSSKTILQVHMDKQGYLRVTLTDVGTGLALCRVNATHNGWSPEACRALHSTALSAYLARKPVDVYFGGPTCPSNLSWVDVSTPVASGGHEFYHMTALQ